MTTIQELLKTACEDSGEVRFHESYSGRGMYGSRCVGISGDVGSCMEVIKQIIKEAHLGMAWNDDLDFDSVVDLLLDWTEDSLGLGVVYYWPQLKSETKVEPAV